MKKIKAFLLAVIIATSCFAGTIATSAVTTADDTAFIYVTDVDSEASTDYPIPETPSAPALTAKVGDIIEVTVNAKANKSKKKFAGLWLTTYFSQSKAGDHDEKLKDKSLAFTGEYYDGGLLAIPAMEKGVSIITNPNPFATSSDNNFDNNFYIYTASCAYEIIDYSNTKTMYKFTLEVKKPGKTFINTTKHEVIVIDENHKVAVRQDLLDVQTSVAVVGHIDKPILTGDINSDGIVDVNDVTAGQQYLADSITLTESQINAADMDGNGTINVKDITAIQVFISKNG